MPAKIIDGIAVAAKLREECRDRVIRIKLESGVTPGLAVIVVGDNPARAEITQLADTLRANLDKIIQHGKRADAIVKNMLLHSREGSLEHRVVDINTLVEESLNTSTV